MLLKNKLSNDKIFEHIGTQIRDIIMTLEFWIYRVANICILEGFQKVCENLPYYATRYYSLYNINKAILSFIDL